MTRAVCQKCAAWAPLLLAGGLSCAGDPIREVRRTSRIEISAPSVAVGDDVAYRIAGEDGSDVAWSTFRVQATPEGIVDLVAPGRLHATAPGTVQIVATSDQLELTAKLDVACPASSATVVQHAGDPTSDETWTSAQGVHLVTGVLHLNGVTLTIDGCSQIRFAGAAGIVVGEDREAKLIVHGWSTQPTALSGDGAQRWQGIRFMLPRARGSALRHVEIRGADGWSDTRAVVDVQGDGHATYDEAPVLLNGVDIAQCAGDGIRIRNLYATYAPRWLDNQVTECSGYPVTVDATSLGAVPNGHYSLNGVDEVECVGGWSGPNYQVWQNPGVPYLVTSSIVVTAPQAVGRVDEWAVPNEQLAGGRFVIVEAGVKMRFLGADSGLYIGNPPDQFPIQGSDDIPLVRFTAIGTLDQPVVFTSADPNPAPGQWVGLVFGPNTGAYMNNTTMLYHNSSLTYAIVEYAGAPSAAVLPGGETLRGGLVVISLIGGPVSAGRTDLENDWFLRGSTVRWNAGFGIVIAEHTGHCSHTDVSADQIERREQLRPGVCICGNEDGEIRLLSRRFKPAPLNRACPCGLVGVPW